MYSTDFEHKNVAQLKAQFEIGGGRNVYVRERETHIAMRVRERHTSQCVCVRERDTHIRLTLSTRMSRSLKHSLKSVEVAIVVVSRCICTSAESTSK